jgi:hypothetical protein
VQRLERRERKGEKWRGREKKGEEGRRRERKGEDALFIEILFCLEGKK